MDRIYTRRDFFKHLSQGLCGIGVLSQIETSFHNLCELITPPTALAEEKSRLKEVRFYKKLPDFKIQCEICPKRCEIADLERGYCGNKENRKGVYYSLVYAESCAAHIDPIEKKPLFHYLPSTKAFSIASVGCNFECRFCQNWRIAQYRPEQVESFYLPPKEIVSLAKRKDCPTIAYTYTEPVVFYDYMYDAAKLAKSEGIGSVMISNGYINEKPLVELCTQLTGVKIDLKAFTEKFYKDYCSGELKPVLTTLKTLKKIGIWYEIVVLLVPTLNDSEAEISEMCQWIKSELGVEVPVHFSRFHPMYKIKNLPSTPVKTLENARKVARKIGLHYVYLGNVPGNEGENTYCPSCGEVLIRRIGYHILKNTIKAGRCLTCGHVIPGVWERT
jgi:pyruvate formate lyase activating enzyme